MMSAEDYGSPDATARENTPGPVSMLSNFKSAVISKPVLKTRSHHKSYIPSPTVKKPAKVTPSVKSQKKGKSFVKSYTATKGVFKQSTEQPPLSSQASVRKFTKKNGRSKAISTTVGYMNYSTTTSTKKKACSKTKPTASSRQHYMIPKTKPMTVKTLTKKRSSKMNLDNSSFVHSPISSKLNQSILTPSS